MSSPSSPIDCVLQRHHSEEEEETQLHDDWQTVDGHAVNADEEDHDAASWSMVSACDAMVLSSSPSELGDTASSGEEAPHSPVDVQESGGQTRPLSQTHPAEQSAPPPPPAYNPVSSQIMDEAIARLDNEIALRPRTAREARLARIHDATCKLCDERICGTRWLCKECPAWSVCEDCAHNVVLTPELHPGHTIMRIEQPSDTIVLGNVSQPGFHELGGGYREMEHRDVQCFFCYGALIGARFECAVRTCRKAGVVMCQECEAFPIAVHPRTHPLVKYRTLVQLSLPLKDYSIVPLQCRWDGNDGV